MLLVSYNILSHYLTEKDRYPRSEDHILEPNNRLKLIQKKLKPILQKSGIITLQEIPLDWTSELHTFFWKEKYYFVTAQYGKKKNGYMGVGIAFPSENFDLLNLKIHRLSDQLKWIVPSKLDLYYRSFRKYIEKLTGNKGDKWDHPGLFSKDRLNQSIFIQLKDKKTKKSFALAIYHMPMAFFLPQAMTIHSVLLFQKAQQYAGNLPLVITGDFNITPKSYQYKYLSNGHASSEDPAFPGNLLENWRPSIQPMRSAYFVKNAKEPDWTNFGQNGTKEPFVDTLDYIWLSPTWKVKSVLPLPSRSEISTPLPCESEPSDHLMIGADLIL